MSKVKTLRNVFQMKVILKGSKPPIWRRVLIPSDITLDRLHKVIQICMGWTDTHLHQFICRREYYGVPDDDSATEVKNEIGVKIFKWLKKEKDRIFYEYDFGDSWLHEIVLEKLLPYERKTKISCMKGVRACPPEDCGGIYGYCDMIRVLSDENNPEYEDMKEWVGEDFDPEYFNITETNKLLDKYVNSGN